VSLEGGIVFVDKLIMKGMFRVMAGVHRYADTQTGMPASR
jgi:hypothetical protein